MAEDHQRTQASPEDLIAQFKAVIQEQRKKQDNLRYVHQFLTSSQFIDLRDADLVVSDQPEAIAERKADLDYRIKVLGALLTMLQEERTALDRTKSVHEPPADQPDTPPLADAVSGDAADASAASTSPSPEPATAEPATAEPATPEPDAPHSRAPDVQPLEPAPAAATKPKRSSRKSSASGT